MRLKKHLTLLCAIVITTLAVAQDQGIQFNHGSWKDLLAKAKQENKLIFIDAYTSWCGPCKWMAKNVFTNDTVAEYYNKTFVCAKIDMEKGEGPGIAKQFSVRNYPTILYVDADANLVHRTCGVNYGGAATQKFIADGKNALNPDKQLSGFKIKYDAGKLELSAIPSYLNMLRAACMTTDIEAASYLSKQSEKELSSQQNWNIIRDFLTNAESREFNYLVNNTDDFVSKYGKDSIETKIAETYTNALINKIRSKDLAGYDALKRSIPITNHNINSQEIILFGDMYLYENQKDWMNYSTSSFTYIDAYAANDAYVINTVTWNIYENVNDKIILERAAKLSKHSTELQDISAYNDTYACLLYKLGKKNEAMKAAERAIEQAKKNNEDFKSTQELLEKIKLLK